MTILKTRIAVFILLFGLCFNNLFSQGAITTKLTAADSVMTDVTKSVYKNLETRKFYSVQMSANQSGEKNVYEVNGKKVSKMTYNKYYSKWKNMVTCKPCILESYDENDILISKGIQYTDCSVGFRITYYPNKKIKLIAHYKENDTGNWKNA